MVELWSSKPTAWVRFLLPLLQKISNKPFFFKFKKNNRSKITKIKNKNSIFFFFSIFRQKLNFNNFFKENLKSSHLTYYRAF